MVGVALSISRLAQRCPQVDGCRLRRKAQKVLRQVSESTAFAASQRASRKITLASAVAAGKVAK